VEQELQIAPPLEVHAVPVAAAPLEQEQEFWAQTALDVVVPAV
jgi:hypothetical protein